MSDVSLARASSRGRILFFWLTTPMFLLSEPKFFTSRDGLIFLAKRVGFLVVAGFVMAKWYAYVGGPWYGLPLAFGLIALFYLRGRFLSLCVDDAEHGKEYWEDAYARLLEKEQLCQTEIAELKNPSRVKTPRDRAQFELKLEFLLKDGRHSAFEPARSRSIEIRLDDD